MRPDIRYILGILIGIGMLVLVFVLIAKGFSGGKATPHSSIDLASYASTPAVAQIIIDSPINGDQEHRAVKISVSRDQTEIDILQGYQGEILTSQTFPNNQDAFAVFLKALQYDNFTAGDANPKHQDERGACPTGERYVYSLDDSGTSIVHFWTTTCGVGTFTGNKPGVRELFQAQIPGKVFGPLTKGIPLTASANP